MRRLISILFVCLFVIACGEAPEQAKQSNDNALAETISASAEKTLSEGTARTYSIQVMDFEDESQGVLTMEMRGVIDFETLTQRATMTSSGEGGNAPLVAQQIGRSELIGKGLVMYMKSDAFAMALQPGTEWIKMDLEAAGEELGLDLGSLMPGSNAGSQQLDYLTGVENVEEVGSEDVRGVPTTHYRGTGSFEAVKEHLPEDADETIDKLQEMLGVDEFDIEVWLDEDGLARRMSFVYGVIPMGTTPAEGEWKMTLEYFDFGVEVDVKFPPEDEVTDILEVMRDYGAGT